MPYAVDPLDGVHVYCIYVGAADPMHDDARRAADEPSATSLSLPVQTHLSAPGEVDELPRTSSSSCGRPGGRP